MSHPGELRPDGVVTVATEEEKAHGRQERILRNRRLLDRGPSGPPRAPDSGRTALRWTEAYPCSLRAGEGWEAHGGHHGPSVHRAGGPHYCHVSNVCATSTCSMVVGREQERA
ncbi:Hypothetical protein AA314_05810 [Archangium gephyra]|uniref:Uncharacterized protein n=1 Tax=Archangium gephyra TaxID=48 RepID=A0AAC8QBA6_9BACT|nr:Hypothetical protein AA314_05810 [Archangium gephyra]